MSASFGDDAFIVFRGLLTEPGAFVGWSIEDLFGADGHTGNPAWAEYLRLRYPLLCGGQTS